MSRINLVVIAGNLCRDPELKYTPSGAAVCSLTIANNEAWKGKDGEKKEKVNFVNCTVFGPRGEIAAEYLKKGSGVTVKGKLDFQQWEDKEGKKRDALKVTVNDFFFDPKSGSGGSGSSSGGGGGFGNAGPDSPDIDEEDIPF